MHDMLWLNWCAFAKAAIGECTLIAFFDRWRCTDAKKKEKNESRTFVEPVPKCSTLCVMSWCVCVFVCAHFIAAANFLFAYACVCPCVTYFGAPFVRWLTALDNIFYSFLFFFRMESEKIWKCKQDWWHDKLSENEHEQMRHHFPHHRESNPITFINGLYRFNWNSHILLKSIDSKLYWIGRSRLKIVPRLPAFCANAYTSFRQSHLLFWWKNGNGKHEDKCRIAYLSSLRNFLINFEIFSQPLIFFLLPNIHWEWGMGSGNHFFFSFPRIDLRIS